MTGNDTRRIRMQIGMTQEQFAHLLGVSVGSISKWESGKTLPSPLAIDKIKSIMKEKEYETRVL